MPEVKNNIIKEQYFSKDNTFFTVAKTNPKDLVEKEIGDSKVTDKFLPQQKITRWDNEVNFSVRLVNDEKTPTVTQDGDIIKWDGEKISAHFYDVSDVPEGASEFEIILKEKPKTNVVAFTLNTKGLDFSYQPALTEEEIANGSQRDENVIGSYAVYASENKTNYVGGKEYKCGKVGHIFRPKIIDAVGTEVWGELNIDKDLLTVTIPQEFLDIAVYPVSHAAGLTFGYTSNGASSASLPGAMYITGKYATSEDSNVTSMSSYLTRTTNTATGKNLIYSDNSGSPNSLLATGAEFNITVGTGWYSGSISYSAVASTNYWLALATVYGKNITYFYDATGGNAVVQGSRVSGDYTTIVNPYPSGGTSSSKKISIYATYTADEAQVYTLTCASGTATATGTTTSILVSRLLSATKATCTATGNTASLLASRLLTAQSATGTATGHSTAIIAARKILCTTGTAVGTGYATILLAARKLVCAKGTATAIGFSTGIYKIYRLSCSAGTAVATGFSLSFLVLRKLICERGVGVARGFAVGLIKRGQAGLIGIGIRL